MTSVQDFLNSMVYLTETLKAEKLHNTEALSL